MQNQFKSQMKNEKNKKERHILNKKRINFNRFDQLNLEDQKVELMIRPIQRTKTKSLLLCPL